MVGGLAALTEAGVVGSAAGLAVHTCAYPVLGVAVALVGGAAVLRSRRAAQAVVLEGLAIVGGLAALVLTLGESWHTALTLTLVGVAVGLTALRSDRRPAAYLALALEVVASWLWLGTAGIGTPEAYTLPAALIGLVAGLLALRRKPEQSSWITLGPGLAAAFLPSLVLVFSGSPPLRSLLLGLAALGVLIAGAATRRQAPFALGGVVLALVAVREIWPLVPWSGADLGAALAGRPAAARRRRHVRAAPQRPAPGQARRDPDELSPSRRCPDTGQRKEPGCRTRTESRSSGCWPPRPGRSWA